MGRDRKNEARVEHFAKMQRRMMQTPAWRALTPAAQALFPWLLLEWRGPNANNNGKIRFSVRQAQDAIGIGKDRAARAFHELQAKGFIVVTEHGCLGATGEAKGPAYEVTTIQLPHGEQRGGRKLFESWQPGKDFPVHKSRPNNAKGRNGRKTETHHQTEDRNVIEMRTVSRGTSSK